MLCFRAAISDAAELFVLVLYCIYLCRRAGYCAPAQLALSNSNIRSAGGCLLCSSWKMDDMERARYLFNSAAHGAKAGRKNIKTVGGAFLRRTSQYIVSVVRCAAACMTLARHAGVSIST
jgi:hypothetical protein